MADQSRPVTGQPFAGGRIPSLDGLRGVAILMVLMGHALYLSPASVLPWLKYAGNGALGVSIFFVLSGFLIHNLSVREIEKTGSFSWKQFYIRRVLRIFPCFYFFIAVVLILWSRGQLTLSRPAVISAATFSLNYRHLWDHWRGWSDYFVLGHYWTLALEEQFYLTWPILMGLLARQRLLPALVLIIALMPFLRVACYFLTPGSRDQMNMMFHTGFDSIAAGVLLGELFRRPSSRAWLQRLASQRVVVPGAIVFLVFFSPLLEGRFRGAYQITVGKSCELVCLCLVITAAVSFPRTLLSRFLNWAPLAYVGVLSYSLYVWNNLFLYPQGHWLVNTFPLNLACVLGMALFSHYLVERPFLRLKDRFHKPAILPVT